MNAEFKRIPGFPLLIAVLGLVAAIVLTAFLPERYQYGTEIVVSRNVDRTWKSFTDPPKWKKTFPAIQSVDESFSGKRGVGEEIKVETLFPGGKDFIAKLIITDWVKGEVIEDRHAGDWLNGRPLPVSNVNDRIEFAPAGKNKTKITFRESFEVKGPVNKWIAYFFVKPAASRMLAEFLNDYNENVKRGKGNTGKSQG